MVARKKTAKQRVSSLERRRCPWCGRPRGKRWKSPCPRHGKSGSPPKRTQAQLRDLYKQQGIKNATESKQWWDNYYEKARQRRASTSSPSHVRHRYANEKTADRIRKLIRLSRSPNPHEAALARQRAEEMMAEHGIREEDL